MRPWNYAILTSSTMAAAVSFGIAAAQPAVPGKGNVDDSHASAETATTANGQSTVGEVVVTARKTRERLQDVPESISALSAVALAEAHVTRIDDIGALVPNLNIHTRSDNTPDVVIRGVGTFGLTQGVGFYVDDVQLFEGETVRPYDIEQVEVLKGPQGTLYGGNNIGGAIKYITKLPTDTPTAQATGEVGSFDWTSFSGVVSGPLIPGVLKARVSLYDDNDNGFVYDTYLKRHIGVHNEAGERGTLEYTGDKTTVILTANASQTRSRNENLFTLTPGDATTLRTVQYNFVPYYHRTLEQLALHVTHDLDAVTLTSITSYFNSRSDQGTDLDKTPQARADIYQRFTRQVASEEVRLGSHSNGPLRWVIGLFGEGVNGTDLQKIYAETAMRFVNDTPDEYRERSLAAFGNANYSWSGWELSAGARVEYYRNVMTDVTVPATVVVHDVEFLPKISLSYHFDRNVMGYGSFSQGFLPANLIDENSTVHTYKAEHTTNYELGLKSTLLENRVSFNVAGFYTQYANRLFSHALFLPDGTQTSTTENIGGSHNYGAELDASGQIGRELTLSGSVGVTKAIWERVNYYDQFISAFVNLKGLTAPDTPETQATVTLNWRHRLSEGLVFEGRIDESYVGRSYWDVSDHTQQRSYESLNVGGNVEIGSRFEIAAHVTNLLDRVHDLNYLDKAISGLPYSLESTSQPRRFYVSATARF